MSQHGSDIELQIAALEVGSAQQLDVCNMGMQALAKYLDKTKCV